MLACSRVQQQHEYEADGPIGTHRRGGGCNRGVPADADRRLHAPIRNCLSIVGQRRTEADSSRRSASSALDELSSLLPDLIKRGPELGPSFVNLMELPPRFARSERDEEAAAQAGHLRMIAKPTDGLLVGLAAAGQGILISASSNGPLVMMHPSRKSQGG